MADGRAARCPLNRSATAPANRRRTITVALEEPRDAASVAGGFRSRPGSERRFVTTLRHIGCRCTAASAARGCSHHELNRRHAKAGSRLGSLRRAFAGAVERAELPEDLNQHDLSHRRVTTWLAEGKPAHIVQKAMGHSGLRTTLLYAHLVDEDLLQLVEETQRSAAISLWEPEGCPLSRVPGVRRLYLAELLLEIL